MEDRSESKSDKDILQNSSLYREFLAEREEILRHKWIESEKQHRDIGFERALLDWIRNHRDAWRAQRREQASTTTTSSQTNTSDFNSNPPGS